MTLRYYKQFYHLFTIKYIKIRWGEWGMSDKYQKTIDTSKVDQTEDAGLLYNRTVSHDIQSLTSNALNPYGFTRTKNKSFPRMMLQLKLDKRMVKL